MLFQARPTGSSIHSQHPSKRWLTCRPSEPLARAHYMEREQLHGAKTSFNFKFVKKSFKQCPDNATVFHGDTAFICNGLRTAEPLRRAFLDVALRSSARPSQRRYDRAIHQTRGWMHCYFGKILVSPFLISMFSSFLLVTHTHTDPGMLPFAMQCCCRKVDIESDPGWHQHAKCVFFFVERGAGCSCSPVRISTGDEASRAQTCSLFALQTSSGFNDLVLSRRDNQHGSTSTNKLQRNTRDWYRILFDFREARRKDVCHSHTDTRTTEFFFSWRWRVPDQQNWTLRKCCTFFFSVTNSGHTYFRHDFTVDTFWCRCLNWTSLGAVQWFHCVYLGFVCRLGPSESKWRRNLLL